MNQTFNINSNSIKILKIVFIFFNKKPKAFNFSRKSLQYTTKCSTLFNKQKTKTLNKFYFKIPKRVNFKSQILNGKENESFGNNHESLESWLKCIMNLSTYSNAIKNSLFGLLCLILWYMQWGCLLIMLRKNKYCFIPAFLILFFSETNS